MYNVHIRSIFRLFLPINALPGGTIIPFAQADQFGFHLHSAYPAQSYQYNIKLFNIDDLCEVSPGCFGLAKRKAHYFQPSTSQPNAIDGIFLRLKFNHGFFDFRKSNRINVRLDVSCFDHLGEFVRSGASQIFILLPKRRKARDRDDEGASEFFFRICRVNLPHI